RHLSPLAERLAAARALAHHPRIDVTGFEAEIGSRYTYDTVRYLRERCPGVRFVWIMGADNLRSFHRWQKWRALAAPVPPPLVDPPRPRPFAAGGRPRPALAPLPPPPTAGTTPLP